MAGRAVIRGVATTSADVTPPAPHTLQQYAMLADGERGAIIGPDGAVVWMCVPRWHSAAVFASLIGGGGFYRITPAGPFVWGGYYEEGTLIWRSRWVTSSAIVECREALACPATPECAVLVRRIIGVDGEATVHVALDPRAEYGTASAHDLRRDDDGSWTSIAGDVRFRWHGAPDSVVPRDGGGHGLLAGAIRVRAGDQLDLVLEAGTTRSLRAPRRADSLWAETEQYWASAVPPMEGIEARRDARHAYAVLQGMTTADGAMVAAATTSMPERAEAGRNYDYRYVWIRDQAFAGLAAASAGALPLLDDSVRFVARRLLADGPSLTPASTVQGERIPDERSLSLPGYPGGSDIVGNHVNDQFQLDIFGQALLLLAAAARHDRLDADGWRAADVAVDVIGTRRHDVDAGIWELEPTPWTHSRLECVAGLRAISAAPSAPAPTAERCRKLADDVLTDVAASSLHPTGAWKRAPGDDRVDAALLLAAVHGALPNHDPRSRATHDAVLSALSEDGYLYRFRHDDQPLAAAEGAFLVCGFWMSLSLLGRGELVESARWFERNRAACGAAGLYAEEFDVGERQLRGNLPQAFVHAGMLECAARLSERL